MAEPLYPSAADCCCELSEKISNAACEITNHQHHDTDYLSDKMSQHYIGNVQQHVGIK